MSTVQQQLANIHVTALKKHKPSQKLYAPGELKENGYTSYVVSPRTDSVIVTRHTTLGERVKVGDKLITLYSETMAQAQADYMVSASEWKRLENLTDQSLSDSQRVQAKTRYLANMGRLTALGLSSHAISQLDEQSNIELGQYSLYAQIAGIVLQDDFAQGQRVSTGQTLMLLADEQNLWVEARLSVNDSQQISQQSQVVVEYQGRAYPAKVIQESHTIDPVTRTRNVRLQVSNQDHQLHAGMFVNVHFLLPTQQPIVTVPETALVRSTDGDWQVFVTDETNQFEAVQVQRGRAFGEQIEVIGIPEGTHVVTQGAFFISSQLAKSSFDPHNH
ncbi:efflux transporter periplasmic adaptor subunit [Pseudoalteromonas amylolytica]|uniref:Efflux transporter periplasmic adaptor subunit n=1 Tax=Pseudoalteromonas amylolytica TaxID=1859457 RepID=A0A1S1MW44_9GAMM|nr:efflux transporter periplasmic adaptor subunit [Pseudoalteromonas sp. JW3]OHU93097.1 efflux transporter periplasmic adaptor subunit [Pseudoalteromonas amylolytica]